MSTAKLTTPMFGSEGPSLRSEVDQCIAAGDVQAARRGLDELWRKEKGPAAASFLMSRYEQIRDRLDLLPYRVAILRSFTVEPMIPMLRAAGLTAGIDFTISLGAFNAYAQEIFDAANPIYVFSPDAVILAVQTRDIAPDLWRDYADLNFEQRRAAVQRVANNFRDWMHAFREHSRAHLIIHALEEPQIPNQGVLDCQWEHMQASAIQQINRELRRLARETTGIYILDYDALVARHGRMRWQDERKWLTVRLPIASDHVIYVVQEWLRFLHPLTGKIAKALVVDLDNTLWGGVIGEDGVNGICLDTGYPGACYQAVQRVLLDLHHRGILLAVCSKNNPDEAMEVLQKHAGMVLSPSHFAAMRINWNKKSHNIREIAAELNIGMDALAFMDDSPVEREEIRAELPEVTVIDLPSTPMQYAQVLRDHPVFERLVLSEEDQKRGSYYVAERQRATLQSRCSSPEDFYRHLQQEVEIAPVTGATLSRVAQLTQRTNQFNVTTHRYTEQEIADIMIRRGWRVFSVRVRDRYADNGLVGVGIIHNHDHVCEIDTFVLSCRVIGRTVETALLSCLIAQARVDGARRIQGWFFPTKKNAPAMDLYQRHGFHLETQDDTGSLWALDVSAHYLPCPEWIRITVHSGDNQ